MKWYKKKKKWPVNKNDIWYKWKYTFQIISYSKISTLYVERHSVLTIDNNYWCIVFICQLAIDFYEIVNNNIMIIHI